MSEANKDHVRGFITDVIDGQNPDLAEKYFARDYVEHSSPPGTPPGIEGLRQGLAMFNTAFPDGKTTVLSTIAEGDRVVTHWSFTGTHTGDLMGNAPTGKQFTAEGIDISRIADGSIVEHWGLFDSAGMMMQLGLMPPPPAPES